MNRLFTALVVWFFGAGSLSASSLDGEPLLSFPPFDDEAGWEVSDPEALILEEGRLELRTSGAAFAWREQRLGVSSILAEVRFDDAEAAFVGVRVQSGSPLSGYVLDLTRLGGVALVQLVGGADTVLQTAAYPEEIEGVTVNFCLRLRGTRLRGWIWPKGQEAPEMPLVEASLPDPPVFAQGRPALGVRGGGAEFLSVKVTGEPFRPTAVGLLPFKREPRFRLTWPSTPGEVYRVDASLDRSEWQTRYWVKAGGAESEAVIPASFSAQTVPSMFFRVVWASQVLAVDADIEVIVPTAPRLAVAWTSSDRRVYGFEWSKDLQEWTPYGALAVEGTAGLGVTSTVLPLPETLTFREAEEIHVRVLDLGDKGEYGLSFTPAED